MLGQLVKHIKMVALSYTILFYSFITEENKKFMKMLCYLIFVLQ